MVGSMVVGCSWLGNGWQMIGSMVGLWLEDAWFVVA